MLPDSLASKRNYWKLDCAQITPKMVRRHFKGTLQLFPELASKLEAESSGRTSEGQLSLQEARGVQKRREVKFSGPFSIESLLKRDSPSARTPRSSSLLGAQFRVEQQPHCGTRRNFSWGHEEPLLLLQRSAGRSRVCPAGGSTHRGLAASPANKSSHVHTQAWWPVPSRTSTAPWFTSPPSSFTRHSLSVFTNDALCLCL